MNPTLFVFILITLVIWLGIIYGYRRLTRGYRVSDKEIKNLLTTTKISKGDK
jgi:hypothetical protein